ncbi:MAG: hypothetical protein ABI299_13765 [Rhodanobacter sp.]
MSAFATAMLMASSSVSAATGRIVFSGAVVEQTCSTHRISVDSEPRLSKESGQVWRGCGRTRNQPGQSYSRVVRRLDTANAGSDRLLSYFVGYVSAEDDAPAQPTLVVRTYE